MIEIDGSRGEGGGQILRSSLALAIETGEPVRIHRIRAGRSRPGLLRQHLAAARAAAEISGGGLEGATLGSTSLELHPGPVTPGDYAFAVGSAGSTTLVLQTVLPALATAKAPSRLTLEGGTHNPHAPPFEFLERVFLPLVARMGPRVTATLERPGFYPAGGGRIVVDVAPSSRLAPLELLERGELREGRAVAVVSALPASIAQRELGVVLEGLGWDRSRKRVVTVGEPRGPGNVVRVELVFDALTEMFTAFGEKGVPAEAVAHALVSEVSGYLASGVPVGPHLADQLIGWMAMGGGGSFLTTKPTPHTLSQIDLVPRFLDARIRASAVGEAFRIDVET